LIKFLTVSKLAQLGSCRLMELEKKYIEEVRKRNAEIMKEMVVDALRMGNNPVTIFTSKPILFTLNYL